MLSAVGTFAGRNGQSAARWLKNVKYELQERAGINEMSPNKILRAVEFLLTEDAEDWVETLREARHLFSLEEPLQNDVEIFATLEKNFPWSQEIMSERFYCGAERAPKNLKRRSWGITSESRI